MKVIIIFVIVLILLGCTGIFYGDIPGEEPSGFCWDNVKKIRIECGLSDLEPYPGFDPYENAGGDGDGAI
jgi:hypothetical protein